MKLKEKHIFNYKMKFPKKTVTRKIFKTAALRFYGGGREINIGDKIVFGFTNTYASWGIPPVSFRDDNICLALISFVIPKNSDKMYQLYKKM